MKNMGVLYASPPLAKQMFASGFSIGILAGSAILLALRFCVVPNILR